MLYLETYILNNYLFIYNLSSCYLKGKNIYNRKGTKEDPIDLTDDHNSDGCLLHDNTHITLQEKI